MRTTILFLLLAIGLAAQTKDASPRTIANGPTDPVTCKVADLFVNTSAIPVLKVATATGPCVWTAAKGVPTGAVDPASCSVGDLFVDTSSTPLLKVASSTGPCVWTSTKLVPTGASDPVSCVVGELFVNTSSTPTLKVATATGPCVWSSTGGGPSTFNDPTAGIYLLEDNFPASRSDVSPCCQLPWFLAAGTIGSVAQTATTLTHPGVKSLTTGAVSGNQSYIHLSYGGSGANFYNLATGLFAKWEQSNTALIDNAAGIAAIANVGYWFGSSTSAAGCGGGGWCIAADTTDPVTCTVGSTNGVTSVAWNPANWMYVMTILGGSKVCLDSGVPALSGTWYKLKISYLTATSTTTFTINGGNAVSIPSGPPTAIQNPFMSVMTRTTAAKAVWLDYWKFIGWY